MLLNPVTARDWRAMEDFDVCEVAHARTSLTYVSSTLNKFTDAGGPPADWWWLLDRYHVFSPKSTVANIELITYIAPPAFINQAAGVALGTVPFAPYHECEWTQKLTPGGAAPSQWDYDFNSPVVIPPGYRIISQLITPSPGELYFFDAQIRICKRNKERVL